ncbi:MAG: RNA degradosome polyphosphate kinase, partial [bacterium]
PSDPSGPSPTQQLEAIHRRVVSMVESQYRCLSEDLEPALQREGMERVRLEGISTRQLEAIERIFQEEIFPVLSPMAIEPENPFPLLQNLGLYLVVRLEDGTLDPPHRFAMIPLGKSTPRFITLPSDSKYSYVLLEDLVGHCVDRFFPGMTVLEWSVCRITRNLDISLRDDGAADLMSGMEQVLLQRRVADSIRLEISQQASEVTTHFLAQSLGLGQREVFRIPGPIDLSSMLSLTETDGFPSLRDPAWLPQPSPN